MCGRGSRTDSVLHSVRFRNRRVNTWSPVNTTIRSYYAEGQETAWQEFPPDRSPYFEGSGRDSERFHLMRSTMLQRCGTWQSHIFHQSTSRAKGTQLSVSRVHLLVVGCYSRTSKHHDEVPVIECQTSRTSSFEFLFEVRSQCRNGRHCTCHFRACRYRP